MSFIKKIFIIALVLLNVTVLTACQNAEPEIVAEEEITETEVVTEEVVESRVAEPEVVEEIAE